MNKLDNHTSARFYNARSEQNLPAGNVSTGLGNLSNADLTSDLTNEQRLNWKRQRAFRMKMTDAIVFAFEISFVGACAYFILRSFL